MAWVLAYIGLGSNLDNPPAQLRRALNALAAWPDCRGMEASPWYRSDPVGPPGQPDYLNAVARLETRLDPPTLLSALHSIENAQGRVREERWGPRTLDLDLLMHGDRVQNDPQLTLPHPRLHQRAFVLYPLADLDPELRVPGLGPLRQLLRRCPAVGLEHWSARAG